MRRSIPEILKNGLIEEKLGTEIECSGLTDERHDGPDAEDDVGADVVVGLVRAHVLQVELLVEEQPQAHRHHAQTCGQIHADG